MPKADPVLVEQIGLLRSQGLTVASIARKLSITHRRAKALLCRILEREAEAISRTLPGMKADMSLMLDHDIEEVSRAWARSRKNQLRAARVQSGDGIVEKTEQSNREGNPAYLHAKLALMNAKMRLHGLGVQDGRGGCGQGGMGA